MKKVALLAMLLLSGCNGGGSHGVNNAIGETSVKFVICAKADENCFISARFRDLDACRNYKHWAGMVCDTNSNTGRMICEKSGGRMKAYSYCKL